MFCAVFVVITALLSQLFDKSRHFHDTTTMASTRHQQLVENIARHRDGAAIGDLEEHFDISRHTLQRRLKRLAESQSRSSMEVTSLLRFRG